MDFIMLVIPVPVILKLQMSKRTKVLTLMTFMVLCKRNNCPSYLQALFYRLISNSCLSGSIAKAYIYIKAREDRFFWDGISRHRSNSHSYSFTD